MLLSARCDSINNTDAIRFNNILLKEKGNENDTLLISKYENLLKTTKNELWKNLIKNRISIIKIRSSKQEYEKRLIGKWRWILSNGGWGEDIKTPETEKVEKIIKITPNNIIIYFENNKIVKKDSFFLTKEPGIIYSEFETFIHLINQKVTEGIEIREMGQDIRLTIYEDPLCQDCPYTEYKKISDIP